MRIVKTLVSAIFLSVAFFKHSTAQAPGTAIPASRLPSDMQAASVADDSQAAQQGALARLRQRPRQPVCAGERNDVSSRLGTPCATREFDAPAILSAPRVQWKNSPGYWTNLPFLLVGDRLFSASCADNRFKEGGTFAIDTNTGKVLWRDRKICERGLDPIAWDDLAPRVFALPNQTLLVSTIGSQSGHRQFVHDMKTGRVLLQDKKRMSWRNMELVGSQFISRARAKSDTSYVAARSLELTEPQWKLEEFVGSCPKEADQNDCFTSYNMSNVAAFNGVLYVSAARKDQSGPPVRQLHAIDLKTGSLLWLHQDQPIRRSTKTGAKRADDGSPMVAGAKVIIRINADSAATTFFRALDAKDGRPLWDTVPIPRRFKDEWLPKPEMRRPVHSQEVEGHLISGNTLLVLLSGGDAEHADVWAYSLDNGKALWRRSLTLGRQEPRLGAAAGGVVYVIGDAAIAALEADTGTQLWKFGLIGNVDDPDYISIAGGHMSQNHEHSFGEIFWPDNWLIGPDGGFYITSPFNLTKLR